MINNVTASSGEIAKGLGYKGDLEEIEMVAGDQIRYSVVMPKADFLKAMGIAGDMTELTCRTNANNEVTSVAFTVAGDVTATAKRGRKPQPEKPSTETA